jgi:hypothetical protein
VGGKEGKRKREERERKGKGKGQVKGKGEGEGPSHFLSKFTPMYTGANNSETAHNRL